MKISEIKNRKQDMLYERIPPKRPTREFGQDFVVVQWPGVWAQAAYIFQVIL